MLPLFTMFDSDNNDVSANFLIPRAVMNACLIDDKLNICHINVQSLCARRLSKFEELKQNFIDSKVDIICFTETWLDDSITDSTIAIHGYNLVRQNRNRHGGGVCVYLRQNIRCKILKKSFSGVSTNGRFESDFLILELHCNGNRILLAIYYNPPPNDCSYLLRTHIEEFCLKYDHSFFIGDFNTDLRKQSRKSIEFMDTISSMSFTCINTEPTFFYNNGCSLLDLFLTNSPDLVLRCNQVSMPGISSHDLLFATLNLEKCTDPNGYWYRDYIHYDNHALVEAISRLNINDFLCINDSDMLLNILDNHLFIIHEQVFPLQFKKTRFARNWFNTDIERAIINRNLAYNTWKSSKNTFDHSKYKRLRNIVNSLIKTAKCNYDKQRINLNIPGKQLWKNIKNLGVSKSKNNNICSPNSAEEVNNYFASNYSECVPCNIQYSHLQNCFQFQQINAYEIVTAINSIKSNAAGLDNLPIIFIKIIFPFLMPFFVHLFNTIITTSKFPLNWKRVKVIPITKKSGSSEISNLRPISLLCTLSKVFERIIKDQISQYISDMNFLHPFQSGFRKNHSTETALMKVHDDIAFTVDKKGIAILLLIDFAKAFDRVSHVKLVNKLISAYNFSDPAAKLLNSYLSDRYQAVFLNGIMSSFILCESGVPQGSILGPLLFSLFINDLPGVLKYCSVHLFADDVQIYFCSSENFSIPDISHKINFDLNQINSWSESNLLSINPTKTKALLISKLRIPPDFPNLNLNGSQISFVTEANNLGLIFKNNLEWDLQIKSQCKKIYIALKQLTLTTKHLDVETKLCLFKSLIFPHFIYTDFIYSNASGMHVDRLRIALNACVRYVFNLNRYSHVSHLQKSLIGCNFSNFYKYRSCMVLHRIINSKKPNYLFEKLLPFRNTRTFSFLIPNHSSFYYSQSFFARGIANWNRLPVTLKQTPSKNIFKRDLLINLNLNH